jgi:PAS domain S-box-containing protein
MQRTNHPDDLPARQKQLLDLACEGLSDRQVALQLGISVETVRSHWRDIRARFGGSNRAHIIAVCIAARVQEKPAFIEPEVDVVDPRTEPEIGLWTSVLRSIATPMSIAWGRSGTVVFVNQALEKLMGRPARYPASRYEYANGYHPSGELMKPEDWAISRTIDEGTPTEVEMIFQRADGTWLEVHSSAVPIRQNGEVVGAIGVFNPGRLRDAPTLI